MKKFPLILDLETKHTFRDFVDPKKLGVTVVAVYDYQQDRSFVFLENELNNLFPLIERSSYLIGYNIRSFDLPVLQPYYPGDFSKMAVFDILEDIKEKVGKRLALNDILQATLGLKKTGHGLMAIHYYKEGKIDQLKKYCLDDVILTKKIFDYGVKYSEIFYLTTSGKQVIKVDWKKYLEEQKDNDTHLTLPF